MRILHLLHRFPPMSLGGTEINVHALATVHARNADVIVGFPCAGEPRPAGRFPYEGFRIQIFPPPDVHAYRKLLDPLATSADVERQASELLERIDPDVIHVHQLQDWPVGAIERAIASGRRVFFTLRDFWYCCARTVLTTPDLTICDGPDSKGENCARCWATMALEKCGLPAGFQGPLAATLPIARGLRRRLDRFIQLLNGAQRIISPSRFVLEKHVEYGVNRDLLMHRRNGVDLGPFHGFNRTRSEQIRFGYLGALTREKGVHVAIEAARLAGADLSVWGPFQPREVPYHAALERLAEGRVRFEGRYENPAEPLSNIDCLIVPSLWYENCPGVILQAHAARTPVIASNLGAMPEFVEDGKTGLLFRPGDAHDLSRALKEAGSRTTVDDWSRSVPQPRSIVASAEELLELYSSTLPA